MTLTLAKWTRDRYRHAIAAGVFADYPVELLAGYIVEMAPEADPHANAIDHGGEYLRDVLPRIVRVRESHPVTLPNASEPEPDLAIVHRQQYDNSHPRPEDIYWVIEYANGSLTKDLGEKRKIYAAAGIREYWVVNQQTWELIIFRSPQNGDYCEQFTRTDGTICAIAFPDLPLDISRIIAR